MTDQTAQPIAVDIQAAIQQKLDDLKALRDKQREEEAQAYEKAKLKAFDVVRRELHDIISDDWKINADDPKNPFVETCFEVNISDDQPWKFRLRLTRSAVNTHPRPYRLNIDLLFSDGCFNCHFWEQWLNPGELTRSAFVDLISGAIAEKHCDF